MTFCSIRVGMIPALRGARESTMPVRDARPTHPNLLLSCLPPLERVRLEPRLERVRFAVKDPLYESNVPIAHVYFPLSGLFSIVATTGEGFVVEVGLVGREGMVGLPVF